MPKADGSIVFEAEVDEKKAQKDLNDLNKKIESTKAQLEKSTGKQSNLKVQLDDARKAAEETEAEITRLNTKMAALQKVTSGETKATPETWVQAKMQQTEVAAELQRQNNILAQQDKAAERIAREYAKATDRVKEQTETLEKTKAKAGEAAAQVAKIKAETTGWKGAIKEVDKRFEMLSKRLYKLGTRAAVFTVVYSGLQKVREYLWESIKMNDDAKVSFAQLQGALMTLAQPILDIAIPAFTVLAQVLTAVIQKISQLVSLITGKSVSAYAASAKALEAEKKALSGAGKAADKASKSMASFDEINQLSNNKDSGSTGGASATDIQPSFDFSLPDGLSERLDEIADAVLMIGAGFALWKISDSLPDSLGKVTSKLGGLAVAFGSVMVALDGFTDAWENGVDWGNLAEMIGGVAGAALGLYMAFGKIGAGIALVVGGAGMIVTAFNDICDNGANLQNALLMIAGIVSTGLGFSFLHTSVIPLVIAGIASIVVAILGLTGNLTEFMVNLKENILGGLIEFITGVFEGDWEKAWGGIRKVFVSAWNAIVIMFESAVNLIIKGVNWLIDQLNKIHFELPEWVPGVGGKSYGINISHAQEVKLPRLPALASGAVIPPNREFLAVLGDQKQGTNIETPLPTMIQAFKQALSEVGYGGQTEAYLMLDDVQLGKVIYRLNKSEGNRIGVNLAEV